jgi:hypothetical protein
MSVASCRVLQAVVCGILVHAVYVDVDDFDGC